MDSEIQLISDSDGLAVIGEPAAVELFLESEGLPSRELGLPRLKKLMSHTSAGLQAGSEIVTNSGRWVKLTTESAQKIKKYGLMDSKTPGVSHAMAGRPGDIKGWLRDHHTAGGASDQPGSTGRCRGDDGPARDAAEHG